MGEESLAGKYKLTIDKHLLTVDSENILKGMGMKFADADDYLMTTINNAIDIGLELVKPCASYCIYNNPLFNMQEKTTTIEQHQFNTGAVVTAMLKRSKALAFFICTAGSEIEKLSKREMAAGNGLEGLIFDLIGSELAENITETLHQHIQKKVEIIGQKVSNRFSPGYCNWPVSEQHQLFELLKNNTCGVSLNASALMSPVKSVSGIIGIGQNIRRVKYKCNICDDKYCIMRQQ